MLVKLFKSVSELAFALVLALDHHEDVFSLEDFFEETALAPFHAEEAV